MRRKLWITALSVFLFVMITTAAVAEDVYVTKYGKKYHKANSRFIKNKDVEKISWEEAEARGLKPSKGFFKEELKEDSEGEEDSSSEE